MYYFSSASVRGKDFFLKGFSESWFNMIHRNELVLESMFIRFISANYSVSACVSRLPELAEWGWLSCLLEETNGRQKLPLGKQHHMELAKWLKQGFAHPFRQVISWSRLQKICEWLPKYLHDNGSLQYFGIPQVVKEYWKKMQDNGDIARLKDGEQRMNRRKTHAYYCTILHILKSILACVFVSQMSQVRFVTRKSHWCQEREEHYHLLLSKSVELEVQARITTDHEVQTFQKDSHRMFNA